MMPTLPLRSRLVFQLLCNLCLGVLTFLQPALAADPNTNWQTIETPHFSIHFDSRHYDLAVKYAEFAEQAYTTTAPVFRAWPEKTVIVLDDSTDLANGYALSIPFPMIASYPVLPTALDSISDYGNWGLELLTHEYTHILSFEPATGGMAPLRRIFGSIIRPNILLPRWWLEGLAVEMETRFSNFGRLRSANYLAIPRAMTEEGTLRREDISRINEVSIPDWPGGIRPYLMGAMIWNEMTRQKGDGIIADLTETYSRRLPYFINGPIEDRFGTDYEGLLSQAYNRAEENARKQLDLIHKAGDVKERKLPQEGFFNHSPAISPDGLKLAFVGRLHDVDSFVGLFERRDPKQSFGDHEKTPPSMPQLLVEGMSINRVSWLPDSSGFIYDSIDVFDHYYERSDLYRFDLAGKKKTQLTKGLRAREPAVSPNGQTIAFVEITPGGTRLAIVAIDGSKPVTVYSPPLQTRLTRPEFLSANKLVFTEKNEAGDELLRVLELPRSEPRTILPQFKPAHFPRQTKEGLLFVSDRSGAANLYLAPNLNDSTSVRAVTNTTTRVMTGEFDSNTGEMYYARLDSDGPSLYASERSQWTKAPAAPPQVGPLVDYQWPSYAPPKVDIAAERKPYDPWPYLIPRYWFPYFFLLPEGSYISASTSAHDPLGRHAYSIGASYDTLTERPSIYGQYLNSTTIVPWLLTAQDAYDYIYSGGYRRHITSAGILGRFFIPTLSDDWRGGAGWQYLQTDLTNRSLSRSGPTATLSWSNAKQKGFEISPEKGGSFNVGYTRYLSGLGNIEYDQTDASGAYYFSRGLPERHAIALIGHAAVAPRLSHALLGKTTVGGAYESPLTQTAFVMRGYPSGAFLGRTMLSTTAEYRFPLSYRYKGWGTSPFFIQRVHGDVFTDLISLDGYTYDFTNKVYQRAKVGSVYAGTGAEMKIDTTMFYQLNVQFIFGLYYGFDRTANPYGLYPFVGVGL